MPADVPAARASGAARCLQKDPKQRVGDMQDVRLALEGAFETAAPQTTASATSAAPRGRLAWMAALAVAACSRPSRSPFPRCGICARRRHPRRPRRASTSSRPPPTSPTSFALSPDGRQIVFVASGDGASRLWLRSLATTTAQPLAGTEGATDPFWSPDGRSIGFFAGGALKRLDLGGGAPQTLAPVTNGRGGTWNADGVIVFAPSVRRPP